MLIIDAYNLLGKPMPSPLAGLDEASLCALLELMARVNGRGRFAVVCDGNPKPNSPDPSRLAVVDLVHVGPATDADRYIADMVARHSAARRLTVITDDRALAAAVRRLGARVQPCGRFIGKLSRIAKHQRPHTDDVTASNASATPQADDPTTTDQWLELFGLSEPADDADDPPTWHTQDSEQPPKPGGSRDGDSSNPDDDELKGIWPPW